MRQTLGALLAAMLTMAVTGEAQETKPDTTQEAKPDTKKVDPVVVTATTIATPAEQLGVALSVITGEDFKTYHYSTVDDAFRNIPGVNVTQLGSYGKTSSLSIRGANANQVLILVDGVRVSSPTLGQTDLSDISPDLIDRIEVIRGGQATLYGADAIGGVVNIITKKGTGPFSAIVENTGGNYDTFQNRASINGTYKIVNYSLYGSHLESNGQFKNDTSDNNAAGGRVGITLPYDSAPAPAHRAHHQPQRQAADRDHGAERGRQDASGGMVGEPRSLRPLHEQPGLPGSGRSRRRLRRPVSLPGGHGPPGI